ncbi:unnamed protein product [Allacma fusca]|uniref:Uncharacterized protein n=1 Tax=Allacma fusca TaxID=39272 RepID=A0A8J2LPQ4_9HEXA|nr:unnamed protein product [Allacma fusca]
MGNADIQVINFDENLFKELGDLPPEALAALGQQSAGLGINPTQLSGGNSGEKLPSPSNLWQGGSESLTGDHASDLSAILGSRTVREVLVVRNNRPRPKRGGLRRNVLLFITDKDDVLLYNIKKRSLTRIGNTHKPIIARALELSNHKFNIQSAE